MKKEKIFSKFNITTFNDELEEILDAKPFSENVKNNILNMIYKIEESYDDYSVVKIEVQNEKDFLENILESIKNYCNSIEISNSDKLKEKKYIIDYEKGNIKVNSDYSWLLYAILAILKKKKNYKNEKDMTQNKPIYDFLRLGYDINNIEVIRDFNGWSWINSIEGFTNTNANLVYQNFQYILGNRNIENFMKNIITQDKDLFNLLEQKLEKKYSKEIAIEFLKLFKEIAITEIANVDEEYKKILLEIKQRKQEELNLMDNKKEYLKEITYMKKTNLEIIKGIDKTINNKELLQIEYKLRNRMLKNDEKIFSISYLVDILNDERQEALDKIAEVNKLMEPQTYVSKKEELRNIISELSFDNKDIDVLLISLQKVFIKCLLEEIKFATEKNEIINLFYKVRYYINLLFKSNIYIKDVEELKDELGKLKEKIVQKLLQNKIVFEFSDDKEFNKKILMNILNTKIINLHKVYILLTKENNEVKLEIFDEDELAKVEKIVCKEAKNLKLDKKIKLFI